MSGPTGFFSSDAALVTLFMLGLLGAVSAVLGLIYLTRQYLTGRIRRMVAAIHIPDNVALYPKPMLTEAQARFFHSLEKAVEGEYLVWPQVPLWTFIDTLSNDAGVATVFTNRFNGQRIDFALVDPRTLTVWKAIQVEDRTTQRSDRQRRDGLVEMVLKQAGVPLVRISTANPGDSQAIRMQLGMAEADIPDRKSA